MSAAQFLEAVRRAAGVLQGRGRAAPLWSAPDTRKALLAGLADKGFGREPLAEMQKIIEAENSDLFDVLAYVAFAALIPFPQQKRLFGQHWTTLDTAVEPDIRGKLVVIVALGGVPH
jgi:type I restriction enzyme R subunit